MTKFLKVISAILLSAGVLGTSALAQAQELTLRVEPGLAVPTTNPQADRFSVGPSVAIKPEVSLGSYFSLGPSLQLVALPSDVSGVDAGTTLSLGGFVRVKRPHDEKNTGSGLTAVSPWIDSDLKYVRTGDLDRFGWAVAVGASVPTDDKRWLWVGPFARYDLVNQEDGKLNINTNSAKTLILGISFEFGAPLQKAKVKEEPKEEPKEDPTPAPLTPDKEEMKLEFRPRVQFAWDSSKLESSQLPPLRDVVKAMLADKSYSVRIEGHASSEGQVEHNDKLSQKRANAVLDFLVANGVDRNRLTASGFGSRVPVATNKTKSGRVANRRVEFDVTFVVVKGNK